MWELSDGAWDILHTLKGHMDEVRSVAVSPDGEHVVTASEDKTASQDGIGRQRVERKKRPLP